MSNFSLPLINNSVATALNSKLDSTVKSLSDKIPQSRAEEMQNIAKEFEAVYISQFLREMYAEVDVDAWFGEGPGSEIFQNMMIDEYGKIMAKAGGIGVSDSILRQLQQIQEVNYES